MTDVLDVLIAARAEVEKGWCRRLSKDMAGNVCAHRGALPTASASAVRESALAASAFAPRALRTFEARGSGPASVG
jgi:hypothetical protein